MTFVAQPYERFVDDLLIALTGGTIREEHEYTGIERAYTLGSPDAIVDSLRVFGQRDGAYAVFEAGIDYRYDATEDAIAWLLDGRPPDARTFFYVSYFTSDGNGRLTDRNPGSVTTTLAEAFARQYGVLHKQMELIYRSGFIDLAEGSSLDHVAALLDVERKDAKFAGGEVLFKRATPAPGDIAIAVGTLVSTADGQGFETTAPRTLRRDQLSVVVPVRAQLDGPPGAVPAGAITVVNRPIFGIETVQNARPTFFATDRETDEELRRRVRGRIHRAGRSTLDAIRASLVDGVPELNDANVQVTERAQAPGTVEVRLGVEAGADEAFVRRVDEAILLSRPAGIRVVHNLGASEPAGAGPSVPAPTERGAVVARFAQVGAPEAAQQAPSVAATVLPLRVEVLLRLAEPNLTVSERETIEMRVRDAVVAYVTALPMGAPLVHAKLLSSVAALEEIADASLLVGPAEGDTQPSYRVNLETGAAKATADPRDVAVYLMDQKVLINARVRLEAATAGATVTDAARSALNAGLVQALAGERTVTRESIRSALGATLAAATPDLILARDDALLLTVTYEESGRIVADADQVALDEHEVAVAAPIADVALLGALDG